MGKSTNMKKVVVDVPNARREMKYFEVGAAGTISSATGLITPLTQPIVQGDGSGTRDGESINVVSILCRFAFQLATGAVRDYVRVIVFYDTQANGVYPTVTGSTNGLLTSAPNPNSSYDFPVAIRHRFKILHDETHAMTATGDSATIRVVQNIKFGNHKVYYPATTSVEAANGKGAVYVMFVCDTASPNSTAYDLNCAIKFYDS